MKESYICAFIYNTEQMLIPSQYLLRDFDSQPCCHKVTEDVADHTLITWLIMH